LLHILHERLGSEFQALDHRQIREHWSARSDTVIRACMAIAAVWHVRQADGTRAHELLGGGKDPYVVTSSARA
jgi:hypothetical protein